MLGKVVLTSWLVALPAIAMADVRVDYDRHQDFSKYRTFNLEVGPLVRPDGSTDEQNTLAENRIRNAVTSELLARGLEPTDSGASLVVRVSGRDTERVSIISTGWPAYSGYWHRRWGYRRPYGYGYWGAPYYGDVWTRRYVEGALTVDVIDRQTGALLYRAQVTDEVGKNLDKQVAKSIDKAFKRFPVREVKEVREVER
jgi:Domain of unknown function (DUF4136)